MAIKYVNADGLLYLWTKIKARFVAQEAGKGLSSNDFTTDEKTKLTGIEAGAQVNTVSDVTVNGVSVVTSKKAAITTPTKTSDLTNDSGYQTASQVTAAITGQGYQTAEQVNSAIASKLSGMTGITFSVVESLPETGKAGTIYLKSNGGAGENVYNEYIWLSDASKYEELGTASPDLSGYVKTADLTPVSNADIDKIAS